MAAILRGQGLRELEFSVKLEKVLEQLFHELNRTHFSGELPLPRLTWNTRLSSSAGRFMPGSRNLLFSKSAEIEIATYLKALPDGAEHIKDTLLHEMVHYILWHRRRPYGHTPEFHQILQKVGARRYNPVPKERPVKHWYQCQGCLTVVPARRKIEKSACAACCKKFNHGKYSEKFRLLPTTAPVVRPRVILRPTEKEPDAPTLAPAEIISRLEDLKRMILRN